MNNTLPFPENQSSYQMNDNIPDPITNLDVPPAINQGIDTNINYNYNN